MYNYTLYSVYWELKHYDIDNFTCPPRIVSPRDPAHNLYEEIFQGQNDGQKWALFVKKLDDVSMMQLPISMTDIHKEKMDIVKFFQETLKVNMYNTYIDTYTEASPEVAKRGAYLLCLLSSDSKDFVSTVLK